MAGAFNAFNPYPLRKVNGKTGQSIILEAADVGAYTTTETDTAIAAGIAAGLAGVAAVTHGTASAGQTTVTLSKAMAAGTEARALVIVGGAVQESSQYTFNGTSTATLVFAMAAGDGWRVLNFG